MWQKKFFLVISNTQRFNKRFLRDRYPLLSSRYLSSSVSSSKFSSSSWKSNRFIQQFRRNNSTSSTTNEISFFQKYQKYILLSSPLMVILLFHGAIFYSPTLRGFIEENVLPSYVEYLREKFGFDDEDPIERARIFFINQQNSRAVNIRLLFRDGTSQRYEGIPGNETLFNFLNTIHGTSGIESIEFDDESSNETNSTPIHSSTSISLVSPKFSTSLWEDYDPMEPAPISNPFLVTINQEYLLKRYEHFISFFLNDLRQTGHLSQSNSPSAKPSQPSQSGVKYDAKQAARETIQRLQMLIENYEIEMKHGSREIDAIQEDIQRAKDEIRSLQRKHLNTFYFF